MAPRTIHWRYADDGTGQPGPAVPAIGTDERIVVTNIIDNADIEINESADPTTGVWVNRKTLIHTLPADRVPLIETIPGGRPRVKPAAYFYNAAEEMIDPLAHPHIMGVTHTAVKSGLWSDPTVWNTGTVPGTQAIVSTGAFHVQYDRFSDTIIKAISIGFGGKFSVKPGMDTRLRLSYRMGMGPMEYNDPTESETPGRSRHEVIFHPDPDGPPLNTAKLGDMPMADSNFRGAYKTEMLRAAMLGGQTIPSIPAGANSFTVQNLAALGTSNWRIGDEILVLGTEYVLPATSDPTYRGPSTYYNQYIGEGEQQIIMNEFQFGQDEQVRITGINLTTGVVTFTPALQYAHSGMRGTLASGKTVIMHPPVAHLTRSILFRTASAETDGAIDPSADLTNLQKRAHWMAMFCDVDVRYVQFKDMGRSSTDPSMVVAGLPYLAPRAGGEVSIQPLRAGNGGTLLENPNNVPGKWATHIHKNPGVSYFLGCVVNADVGDEPCPGWLFTHHGGKVIAERNVISNGRGAGMVTEEGFETGQWSYNIVTGMRSDGDKDYWGSRMEYYPKHNGSQGVAMENQSRSLVMHNNILGSSKHAFMWHTQKNNYNYRSPRDVDIRLIDGMAMGQGFSNYFFQSDVIGVINVQIPPMPNNEAWACRHGMSVIHRQGEGRRTDKTPFLMEDFHCVNVPFPMHIPQYSNTYYFKDCLWQGPLNMMTQASLAIILGNVTWDWCFTNMILRNFTYAYQDTGAGLNYEGHIIDVIEENIANGPSQPWRSVRGNHATRDVMGPWIKHPSDTAIPDTSLARWLIRNYVSEDSADLPSPYPLAPYGLKLPANRPNGTPYPPVNPGDVPYAVLGDGTNGAASSGINLTLNMGGGRGQGRVYHIVRDSVGDRRYPDHQSSESFPDQTSVKGPRSFERMQPEQAVQRNGCWNDNGTWKMRTWHHGADRFTHVRFSYFVDWTLVGGHPDFLAAHDLGGPQPDPGWPDKLEPVPKAQRPLFRRAKNMRFLSRNRLEVVAGEQLTHRLRYNDIVVQLSIVGGADAAQFRISNQQLQWASGGTRSLNGADANGDNVYEVIVRMTDTWGNSHEQLHRVEVLSSVRTFTEIIDNFNRANEPITANPNYVMLVGDGNDIRVSNNVLYTNNAQATVDFGSLGSSNMEVGVEFPDWNNARFLFRMSNDDNWISVQRRDDVPSPGLYMDMRVNGVVTSLGAFANQGSGRWKFVLEDNRIQVIQEIYNSNGPMARYPFTWGALRPLELDHHSGVGVMLLPDNAPRGTRVGARAFGYAKNHIDNLTARRLAS